MGLPARIDVGRADGNRALSGRATRATDSALLRTRVAFRVFDLVARRARSGAAHPPALPTLRIQAFLAQLVIEPGNRI
jgi:hypothetical protein